MLAGEGGGVRASRINGWTTSTGLLICKNGFPLWCTAILSVFDDGWTTSTGFSICKTGFPLCFLAMQLSVLDDGQDGGLGGLPFW